MLHLTWGKVLQVWLMHLELLIQHGLSLVLLLLIKLVLVWLGVVVIEILLILFRDMAVLYNLVLVEIALSACNLGWVSLVILVPVNILIELVHDFSPFLFIRHIIVHSEENL